GPQPQELQEDGGRAQPIRNPLMPCGRVVGTVVCTERVPSLRRHRLLLLQPAEPGGPDQGRPLVAVDLVSSAPGQRVFYVRGREAASALPDPDNPADAAIVGIVDWVREQPVEGPVCGCLAGGWGRGRR